MFGIRFSNEFEQRIGVKLSLEVDPEENEELKNEYLEESRLIAIKKTKEWEERDMKVRERYHKIFLPKDMVYLMDKTLRISKAVPSVWRPRKQDLGV